MSIADALSIQLAFEITGCVTIGIELVVDFDELYGVAYARGSFNTYISQPYT